MFDEKTTPYAILLLRLGNGALLLAHGLMKVLVFTPAGTVGYFESIGLPACLPISPSLQRSVAALPCSPGFIPALSLPPSSGSSGGLPSSAMPAMAGSFPTLAAAGNIRSSGHSFSGPWPCWVMVPILPKACLPAMKAQNWPARKPDRACLIQRPNKRSVRGMKERQS